MSDERCAERIGDHLARRVADLNQLTHGLPLDAAWTEGREPSDEDREAADEELSNYPLGVSTERVVRVDLSTGGPGDWFEMFYQEGESDPHRIVYHFADWFDHAEVTLEGDHFRTVEDAFGFLGEVYT